MKTTKTKNKIFGFLSKTSVKKFALILYVTVPLLIFATGFAAWTIIGHEIKPGANGSFVADGIINSYDFIELQRQGEKDGLTSIDLFPTGFVGSDGKVTNQVTIDVTYTLKNAACQGLVKENNDQTLYADFTLMFSNGNKYGAFFDNLSCSVTDGSNNPLPNAFTKIDFYTTGDPNYSNYGAGSFKTNASFRVMLVFDPNDTAITGLQDASGNITLKFRYTVDPKTAGDYQTIFGDYQTIISQMKDEKLEPMIDVRITDVAPTA